ncbi:MAG: hypothetical protein ACK5O2_10700 [Microthrixaceae bacterium]
MTSKIHRSIAIALTGLAVLLPASLVGAQEDPYITPSPTVENVTTVAPSPTVAAETDEVANATVQSTDVESRSLAFTGGDAAGLAVIGALALVVGGVMLRVRSRRDATVA